MSYHQYTDTNKETTNSINQLNTRMDSIDSNNDSYENRYLTKIEYSTYGDRQNISYDSSTGKSSLLNKISNTMAYMDNMIESANVVHDSNSMNRAKLMTDIVKSAISERTSMRSFVATPETNVRNKKNENAKKIFKKKNLLCEQERTSSLHNSESQTSLNSSGQNKRSIIYTGAERLINFDSKNQNSLSESESSDSGTGRGSQSSSVFSSDRVSNKSITTEFSTDESIDRIQSYPPRYVQHPASIHSKEKIQYISVQQHPYTAPSLEAPSLDSQRNSEVEHASLKSRSNTNIQSERKSIQSERQSEHDQNYIIKSRSSASIHANVRGYTPIHSPIHSLQDNRTISSNTIVQRQQDPIVSRDIVSNNVEAVYRPTVYTNPLLYNHQQSTAIERSTDSDSSGSLYRLLTNDPTRITENVDQIARDHIYNSKQNYTLRPEVNNLVVDQSQTVSAPVHYPRIVYSYPESNVDYKDVEIEDNANINSSTDKKVQKKKRLFGNFFRRNSDPTRGSERWIKKKKNNDDTGLQYDNRSSFPIQPVVYKRNDIEKDPMLDTRPQTLKNNIALSYALDAINNRVISADDVVFTNSSLVLVSALSYFSKPIAKNIRYGMRSLTDKKATIRSQATAYNAENFHHFHNASYYDDSSIKDFKRSWLQAMQMYSGYFNIPSKKDIESLKKKNKD